MLYKNRIILFRLRWRVVCRAFDAAHGQTGVGTPGGLCWMGYPCGVRVGTRDEIIVSTRLP